MANSPSTPSQQSQPFTRLPVPPQFAALAPVLNDIYDKLNAVAALVNQIQSK